METESKKRFFKRKSLRWILIGLPMAAVVIGGCLWYFENASLESQLAELRAAGLPTTGNELNEFYAVPEGVADSTELWIEAIDAVQDADLYRRGKMWSIVGEGPIPVPGGFWAELEAVRTFLQKLDVELQAVRKAVESGGHVRYPVDFSAGIMERLPYTHNLLSIAQLLSLDAYVSAHDGNDAQALRDLQAILVLSDTLQGEPTLVSQLVRIAIHAVGRDAAVRFLPHCNWSDAELESLQTAIGAANFKEELRNAMVGERAICLTELDQFWLGPLRPANKHKALQLYESSIEGLSNPWPAALVQQRKIDTRINSIKRSTFTRLTSSGVWMLFPAMKQTALAVAQSAARQRSAIAAIAAQRFRLQHGRLPDSLAEIETKMPGSASERAAQLIDPFDGQPLRFKAEETQVVIYSIGQNEQDDGGDFEGGEQSWYPDIGYSVQK